MRIDPWRVTLLTLSTVGILTVSVPALANEPATANSIQLGLGFRYGYELEEGDFNPWGTGLGFEGGLTLPNAIYVGGNIEYFFGETREELGSKLSGNVWQAMAEGGYDIGLGDNFVIRPKIGAGLAGVKFETCLEALPCEEDSTTDFALAPGATFLLLTSKVSVTLDFRYDMIFADPETLNALIFSAGIGF